MDTLTRIRAFIDVVEAEGFSAAARRTGRSKALLSKYVRELEDELGALLLNRTTRQFSLTEAGHTYYRTASDILKEIDNLADLVRENNAQLKGRLRISVPRTFVDADVGQSLIDFAKENPDLSAGNRRRRPFRRSDRGGLRRGDPRHEARRFGHDRPQDLAISACMSAQRRSFSSAIRISNTRRTFPTFPSSSTPTRARRQASDSTTRTAPPSPSLFPDRSRSTVRMRHCARHFPASASQSFRTSSPASRSKTVALVTLFNDYLTHGSRHLRRLPASALPAGKGAHLRRLPPCLVQEAGLKPT